MVQVTNLGQVHHPGNLQPVLNKGTGNSSQPVEVPVQDRIEQPVNPDNLNIVEW